MVIYTDLFYRLLLLRKRKSQKFQHTRVMMTRGSLMHMNILSLWNEGATNNGFHSDPKNLAGFDLDDARR